MLLSIGVVTYRRPELLDELLTSIYVSDVVDGENVELVILDNGSDEATSNILSDWRNKLTFTLLRSEQNVRGRFAYMSLLKAAKGDWLICPGDDDRFKSKGLNTVISECKAASKSTSLIPFGATTINSEGKPTPISFRPKSFESSADFFSTVLFESPFWMPATAIRRNFVDYKQIPKSITVVDWWLWLNGGLKGIIKSVAEPVVEYRIHQGQEQKSYLEESWQLDRATSFVFDISNGVISSYLDSLSLEACQDLIQRLNFRVKSRELNLVDKFLLIFFSRHLLNQEPELSPLLKKLLINGDVDLRFCSTLLDCDLSIEDYKIFMERLERKGLNSFGSSAEVNDSLMDLEEKLSAKLSERRLKEINDTLTPFEKRIIRIFRLIRFNSKFRWLARK